MENLAKQIKKHLNPEQASLLIKMIHKEFTEAQARIDQLKIVAENLTTQVEALEKAFDEREAKIKGN